MKYHIMLKIPAPETPYYLEIGVNYDLPFHPNKTDQIYMADYMCNIKYIDFDIDTLDCMMKLEACDDLLFEAYKMSHQEIIEYFEEEGKSLEDRFKSQNKKMVINSCNLPKVT